MELEKREIKFKTFNKELGVMSDPWYFTDWDTELLIPTYWYDYEDDNLTHLQYTGLKDKNGVAIYEGDIVAEAKYSTYHYIERDDFAPSKGIWFDKRSAVNVTQSFTENIIEGRECFVITWQDKETGFYPFADSPNNCGHCGGGYDPLNFEVIGNIYENPELVTPTPDTGGEGDYGKREDI